MNSADPAPDGDKVALLIERFYARIRADRTLGPIFEKQLDGDWTRHVPTMEAFWRSVLLGTREYRGKPVEVHARMPELTEADYAIWLDHFQDAAQKTLDEATAQRAIASAQRIATSLWLGTHPDPFATSPVWTGDKGSKP